jgi:hypothetical protein
VYLLCPPVRIHSKDVDLFRLACVRKQEAKEEADMTVEEARTQLESAIGYLHLPEDSFSIRNGRLQSGNGTMDIPVEKLVAIIPAHGTVMAIWPREEGEL